MTEDAAFEAAYRKNTAKTTGFSRKNAFRADLAQSANVDVFCICTVISAQILIMGYIVRPYEVICAAAA